MIFSMKIIKDGCDFYLCDDDNLFHLADTYTYIYRFQYNVIYYTDYYNEIEGYELGSHEYLFNEMNFFEYYTSLTGKAQIKPTDEFLNKFKAWSRDIKINNIFL